MKHIVLTDESGGVAVLTTDHSASSYGIPVLMVDAEDLAGVFGPSDLLDGRLTGADLVAGWAREDGRTAEELAAARLYLSQWPEGPQVTKAGV